MSALGTMGLLASTILLFASLLLGVLSTPSRFRVFLWARICFYASACLVFWCTILLVIAFLFNDFSLHYVFEHSSIATPWIYRISAMWSGREGSLLLWFFLIVTAGTQITFRIAQSSFLSQRRALVMFSFICGTFLASILAFCNPFAPSMLFFADGKGLSPALQDWAMVVHPPMVFASLAILTGLFVISLLDYKDSKISNLFTVYSRTGFSFLTAGIVLGGFWAYGELGWGGYWGWDPVENMALLPWFALLVLMHFHSKRSSIIERRSILVTGIALSSAIVGTYITRSGILESVHAYAAKPGTAGILAVGAAVFVASMVFSRKNRDASAPLPPSVWVFTISIILLGLTILFETLWPLWGRLFRDNPRPLSASFYNISVGYLGVIFLGCMLWGAIDHLGSRTQKVEASLSAVTIGSVLVFIVWYVYNETDPVKLLAVMIIVALVVVEILEMIWKGSRCYTRNMIHLGMAILAAGLMASMPARPHQMFVLKTGQTKSAGGMAVSLRDLRMRKQPSKIEVVADLMVQSGGRKVVLHPKHIVWGGHRQRSVVDFRMGLMSDIYATMGAVRADEKQGSFRVSVHPLVIWVWFGAGLIVIGSFLAGDGISNLFSGKKLLVRR